MLKFNSYSREGSADITCEVHSRDNDNHDTIAYRYAARAVPRVYRIHRKQSAWESTKLSTNIVSTRTRVS